jgi:DNA-directed RNA polymerase subunit beta'
MKTLDTTNFDYITLKMASPERIREWSYGEVTKPETINYRTGRSERGGLFDERVFGPEKDYECYCGKYKRIRYAGIVCEKCGVEVTMAVVRRERMGHIELASPVAHIWFLRGVPSRMSILTGIPVTDLEKVIYFAGYIVTKVYEDEKATVLKDVETEFKTKMKTANDEETKERLKELLLNIKKEIGEIHEGKVLNEISYHHYSLKYGTCFEASIGAEAIFNLFRNIDLKKLLEKCEEKVEKASSVEREKLQKRIGLVRSMHTANLRPEWMFMTAIPVIPPALRPMVALEGGRHATSDVNDLYRRVINRNNRLKKLKEIGAPDVILRNEKRILQEAVDALFDNSITSQGDSQAMSQSQRRALKSLSDNLKSKQGLFRQNLLGKRVDYSGRSVIVIGPQLRLDQCGLPKHMALELFRPFVIAKLIKYEHAHNTKGANRLIEEGVPEVWAILEEVIEGKYVLLNRAPTLHRLGIQAFHPVLIEGNAIQVHPLVCSAYNADFDGDQMAVYVPLSDEAQQEAHDLMAANKNLLKPQNGDPIVSVKLLDIALGCYWMTKAVDGEKGEGKYFASPNQAIMAYEFGEVSFRSKIKVLGTEKEKYAVYGGKVFETSVGRLLFNSILPADMPFLNEEMPQKRISALIDEVIYRYGIDATPPILDKIKNFGYRYITQAGITWGIDNVRVPTEKKGVIERGRKQEEEVLSQFNDGLLSQDEKYRKIIEIWDGIKIEIEKMLPATLEKNGSVEDMLRSGARGSISNLTQMAGMKGLIVNTAGRTIDFPIVPSYKEGLSPIEYFITTHGARKGLADTALNTARAGYLTRRLVVAAQDVRITEEDCGTKEGRLAKEDNIAGVTIPLSKNLRGRVLAADIKDESGATLYKAGTLITKEDAVKIQESGVKEAMVRSPLACKTVYGLCKLCYGLDLGRNHMVEQGEAVGIIAAQAIGEPGTQLTLRTFHAGGVAGVDITQGLPRIEEIFERRRPHRALAVVAETDGEVMEIRPNGKEKVIVVLSDEKVGKTNTIEYTAGVHRTVLVKVGQKVTGGMMLTDGSADITDIFNYGGKDLAEKYIIDEIMKVYELQGASISKKHIEIIIRQMFSRRKIKQPGDTTFSPGEVVENIELVEENRKMKEAGLEEAKGDMIVLGITESSLNTQSWLAAASFQNTNRVLIANAVKGGEDRLRGLMENVIIGRLIPAGTGFKAQQAALALLKKKDK